MKRLMLLKEKFDVPAPVIYHNWHDTGQDRQTHT